MMVVWSAAARVQLRQIETYIARYDPRAASRVAESIIAAADRLAHFPELGRIGRIAGTRELVIARTPYLIVYRIRPDTVQNCRRASRRSTVAGSRELRIGDCAGGALATRSP